MTEQAARKWQSWDLKLGCLHPESVLMITTLYRYINVVYKLPCYLCVLYTQENL